MPAKLRGRKKKIVQEEQFKVGPEIDPTTLDERQRYNMTVTRGGAYQSRRPPGEEGEWQLPSSQPLGRSRRPSRTDVISSPLSSPVDTDEAQRVEIVKEKLREIMKKPQSSETEPEILQSSRSTPTGTKQYGIERDRFLSDTIRTEPHYVSVEDLNQPQSKHLYERPDLFRDKPKEMNTLKNVSVETGYMSFQDPNDKTLKYHHPVKRDRELMDSPNLIQDPLELESIQERLDMRFGRDQERGLTSPMSICSLDEGRQRVLDNLDAQSPGRIVPTTYRKSSLPLVLDDNPRVTQTHTTPLVANKPLTPKEAKEDLKRVIQQTHASTLYGDPGQNISFGRDMDIDSSGRQNIQEPNLSQQNVLLLRKVENISDLETTAKSDDFIESIMHGKDMAAAEGWLPNTEIKDGNDPLEQTTRKDEDGYPNFYVPGTENKTVVELNARRCHGVSPRGNPLGCIGINPLYSKYKTTYYEYDRATGELFIIRDKSRFQISEKLGLWPYSHMEFDYAYIPEEDKENKEDLPVIPANLTRLTTYDRVGVEEEIRPSGEPANVTIRDDEDGFPSFFIPYTRNRRITEANPRRVNFTSPKGNPMALIYVSELRPKYGTDEIAYDRCTGDMYTWNAETLTMVPDKLKIFAFSQGTREYKIPSQTPRSSPLTTSSKLREEGESMITPGVTPIRNGSAFQPPTTTKQTPDLDNQLEVGQERHIPLIHTPPHSPRLDQNNETSPKVQKTEHITTPTASASAAINTGARPKQPQNIPKPPWVTPKFLEGYEFVKTIDRDPDPGNMRRLDESRVVKEISRLHIRPSTPCEIDDIPTQLPEEGMDMAEKAQFITKHISEVQMKRVTYYAHFKLKALKMDNVHDFHALKVWYGKKLCKLLNKDYNLQLLESKVNREFKEEQERKRAAESKKHKTNELGEGPKTIVPNRSRIELPVRHTPKIATLPDIIPTEDDTSFQFQGDSTGLLTEVDQSNAEGNWTQNTIQQVIDRGTLKGKAELIGHVLPQPQQQTVGQVTDQTIGQTNVPRQPRTNPNFRIRNSLEAPNTSQIQHNHAVPLGNQPITFTLPGPPVEPPPPLEEIDNNNQNQPTTQNETSQTGTQTTCVHTWESAQVQNLDTNVWNQSTRSIDSIESIRPDRGRGRGNGRNSQNRGNRRGRGNGRGAYRGNNRAQIDRNYPIGHWGDTSGEINNRESRTSNGNIDQVTVTQPPIINRDINNNQRAPPTINRDPIGLGVTNTERIRQLPIPGISGMMEGQTSPMTLARVEEMNLPSAHRARESTQMPPGLAKWAEKQRRLQILRQAPIPLAPEVEQMWIETEDIDLFNMTFATGSVETGTNLNNAYTVYTTDPSRAMGVAIPANTSNYQPRVAPNYITIPVSRSNMNTNQGNDINVTQTTAPVSQDVRTVSSQNISQIRPPANTQDRLNIPAPQQRENQQRYPLPPSGNQIRTPINNNSEQLEQSDRQVRLQTITQPITTDDIRRQERPLPDPYQDLPNTRHRTTRHDPDQTYPMQVYPSQQPTQQINRTVNDPDVGPDDDSPFAGGHMSRGGRPEPDHDFRDSDFVIDPLTGHAFRPSTSQNQGYSPDRMRERDRRADGMGRDSSPIRGMRNVPLDRYDSQLHRATRQDMSRSDSRYHPSQTQIGHQPTYPSGTSRGQPQGSSNRAPSRPPSRQQTGPPPLGNPYGSGTGPPGGPYGGPPGRPPGGPPGRPPNRGPPKVPPIDGTYVNVHPNTQKTKQVDVRNLYEPIKVLSGTLEKWAERQDRMNTNISRFMYNTNKTHENTVNELKKLNYSSEQRNFDHLFNTVETYDGTNKKQCLKWIRRLEVLCDKTNRDIKLEALALSKGQVQDCLMSMPPDLPWSECRKELQRCFSDVITDAHAAMKLHFMKQGDENLRPYCNEYIMAHFLATKQYASMTTDKTRIIHFLRSIRNVSIVKKISMGINGLPRTLLEAAQLAIAMEGSYQLSEGISRAYDPDFLSNIEYYQPPFQTIEEVEEPEEVEALMRRPPGRSNKCWICGESGHYHYECPIYIAAEQGDDKAMNTVVGQMTYNLTAQQPVTAKVLKYLIDKLRTVNMMKDKYKKAADKKPTEPATTKPQKKVAFKDTQAQPVRTTAAPLTTTVQRTTGAPVKYTKAGNRNVPAKTNVKTATTSTILRRSPRTSVGKNTVASSANATLAKSTVNTLDAIVDEEESISILEEEIEDPGLELELEDVNLIQLDDDEIEIHDHSQ